MKLTIEQLTDLARRVRLLDIKMEVVRKDLPEPQQLSVIRSLNEERAQLRQQILADSLA